MYSPYDWYITPDEYEEAERNGIRRRCLEDRIRRFAWGKQKALTTPLQKQRDLCHLRSIAEAHGITYRNLKSRIHKGWDDLRASTTPIRDEKGHRENAFRMSQMKRKYPAKLVNLAASNGISYGTFWHRVKRSKWDYSLAATIPPSPFNAALRLKQLYGPNYFEEVSRWMFAPGRIKRGENKKNP